MKQGGHYANLSGRILENIVESALSAKGLSVLSYAEWVKNKTAYGTEVLIKNVPYESIYKHTSKTEFVAKSEEFSIFTRIECKWQQVSGSVDEKFPFLFLNCIEKMLEPHIIILLDGGGAKSGAIEWLAKACKDFNLDAGHRLNRRVDLLNTTQFLQWVNSAFK